MKKILNYSNLPLQTLSGINVAEFARSAYLKNSTAVGWGLLIRIELKHQLERFEKWLTLEKLINELSTTIDFNIDLYIVGSATTIFEYDLEKMT